MWSAVDLLMALFGLVIFAGPLVMSGWMIGVSRLASPWVAVAIAAFGIWTVVFVVTRSPFDLPLTTNWSIMAGLFLAPAMIGAIVSEVVLKRGGGE